MKQSYPDIRTARQSIGLTLDQLAARMGISQSTMVRTEQSEARRTISLQTLERAAQALGMHFEYSLTPQPLSKQNVDPILARARSMSPAEKLLRAIELSELARELKHAPKRPT